MVITKLFGKNKDGKDIYTYEIENLDTKVIIADYGARVMTLEYKGVKCVCGFSNIDDLLADGGHHGAIAGRYANRIENGEFSLNGVDYKLAKNEKGVSHLHGGNVGFSTSMWHKDSETENSVTLKLVSPDGDEGYPGTLTVYVKYTLENNTLSLDYDAVSDKDTIINLTNHMYFNIGGVGCESVLDQTLTMYASHIAKVDERLIPDGTLIPVEGTPFDFNAPKKIGEDINADDEQLKNGGGYDHGFVLSKNNPAAIIHSDKSGITMTVTTTEGGLQMYTGNYMTIDLPFFDDIKQFPNCAVALECNKLPDSPNRPEFPSCVLKKGEHYTQHTAYSFS